MDYINPELRAVFDEIERRKEAVKDHWIDCGCGDQYCIGTWNRTCGAAIDFHRGCGYEDEPPIA